MQRVSIKIMVNKNRALYIFKYLWDHTDEEYPATTADIIAYLASLGISITRKTVAEDAAELQNSGFDVVCNRSRQNEYFIGTRHLELAELKLLVDAVQAARFISPKKSRELIEKVTGLTNPHQRESLRRSLFVDGKVKTGNEAVYYAVDILHTAIQQQKTVMFKYIEYTPQKKKRYKHGGRVYVLSPYDMVWNSDAYYVCGYSESHGKVVTFRVDRMRRPELSESVFCPRSEGYDIGKYCRRVFSMYDGADCTVELKCENSLMDDIVDRFGEQVQTGRYDSSHFTARVQVSVSPTFYAWVFTYGGQIEILSPEPVRQEYAQRLQAALKQAK